MISRSRDSSVIPPVSARNGAWGPSGTVDGVALAALAVGLVPFLGLAIQGSWSPRELGAAAGLLLLALVALLRPT